MKVTCPRCNNSASFPKEMVPENGTKLRCSKCQEVFSVKNEYLKEAMQTDHQFSCPKCKFIQPQTDVCIKCGIVISKFKRKPNSEAQTSSSIESISLVHIAKNVRIFSLFNQKHSSPIGSEVDVLFLKDRVIFVPTGKSSKEAKLNPLTPFFGLIAVIPEIAIKGIVNKLRDTKFNEEMINKVNCSNDLFWGFYRNIKCIFEEEKKPSNISFVFAQNTWVFFQGEFQSADNNFSGMVAFREVGKNQKEVKKDYSKLSYLKPMLSPRSITLDEYLRAFLVDDKEGEPLSFV